MQFSLRKTHPSYFWISLILALEAGIWGGVMIFANDTYFGSFVFEPTFEIIPSWGIGAMYLVSSVLTFIAYVTAKHFLIRIAALLAIIPTAMFLATFMYLFINTSFASISALTKYFVTIVVYSRMLFEPFANPLAIKEIKEIQK